ncbi:hypothetical protein JTB14_021285 [Gonioctena quinquepunctata]|nr:hypothetical protein JTB14_021285 [Gonioctena quinquepunctata]
MEKEYPLEWKTYKQKMNIIEDGNYNIMPREIVKKSGEGSEKGGEAGLVPRTYSMGAQPPSLSQPLDGITNTTNEKSEDEYLSSDNNPSEGYYRKRTKLDQEIKNQSKNPRKEVNTEKYEDEYFTHLSNSECEEEIEQCTENYRITEKILGQITQQKGSSEPMQIVNRETSQNTSAKKTKTHSDRDKSDAKNRNLYPKTITQTDGPSDADNLFSTSSEEEDQSDLSMKKKNTQYARNAKRRKTEKTHEESELDRDYQEASNSGVKSRKRTKIKPRENPKPGAKGTVTPRPQ